MGRFWHTRGMQSTFTLSAKQADVVRTFMARTYSWMAAALVITAAIAYMTSRNAGLADAVMSMRFPLFLVQLGIAFGFGLLIDRVNSTVAGILLTVYAIITGLVFSGLLMVYSQSAVASAFFTTAGTFGAMSVLGFTIKKDLSGMGRFFMFAIIGLVIAMIVNMFIGGGVMSFIISIIGVLLFAGLTVYDTQKLKMMALSGIQGEAAERGAIYGAFALYLDFINMFLFLLSLFGGGSDD